jgi:hypothetical protein
MVENTLFMDVYFRSQESAKLRAKRFGPLRIVKQIEKNAVTLELPDHLRIHPVVHAICGSSEHYHPLSTPATPF